MLQTQEMRLEQVTSAASLEIQNAHANVANFQRNNNFNGREKDKAILEEEMVKEEEADSVVTILVVVVVQIGQSINCVEELGMLLQNVTIILTLALMEMITVIHTSKEDRITLTLKLILLHQNMLMTLPWYLDTSASNHVSAEAQNLTNKVDCKGKGNLVVGNGCSLPISHIGSSSIHSSHLSKPLVL